jgi:CubicO group peptidase (beta-lactamase class C family)
MTPLLLAALALVALPLMGQETIRFSIDGQDLTMEQRMALEQTRGATLVVLLDGKVALNEQWGWRDAENQLPVTETTCFQVGSMSQPLTQFAILQLVDQGILDLDTDINQYLRSWQLPVNHITKKRPLTIRDLLLQRRGFRFPYKPDGFNKGALFPTHLQLLKGEAPAKNPPVKLKKDRNKSGDYSFAPALIFQQILIDHYQLPFPELMNEHVFTPLGMTHSFFAAEPTPAQRENMAVGYGPDKQRLPDDFRRYPELAASGLYTTALDYARFVQAILDMLQGSTDQFLRQELTQTALLPNAEGQVLLFNQGGDRYYWGGATEGYYTQFEADAANYRWVVVALMNDHINWRFNSDLRNAGINYVLQQDTAKDTPKQ